MLPLIPLVLQFAPQLAQWLFGSAAEKTTAAVTQAVQTVVGTTDPTAAAAALAGDPTKLLALQAQLLQIHGQAQAEADAAAQAQTAAMLADVAGARTQTATLAADHSLLAWGAAVLSLVIVVSFAAMLYVVLSRTIPDGSATQANVLLGTLAAMATQVANYWLGSSSGSNAKNGTIAQATTALANSAPVRR